MPAYLLDTDTVSYYFQQRGDVVARLTAHPPSALCISSLTLAELRHGASRVRSARLHAMIDEFIQSIAVSPFDRLAADHFGQVAAALTSRGVPIGTIDTLLAAQAVAHKLVLVTNNTNHFSRVPGLRTENWL